MSVNPKSVFRRLLFSLAIALAPSVLLAQEPVTIHIDARSTQGPLRPVWKYFGYDEPNYTYAKHGQELVGELGALSPTPVYIRTHNLLTSGDGTPGLKWGSTNAYTEDASGKPVYDWTIVDRIFDTYLEAGAKPFVEIGFMPQALSLHPEPYRHNWPMGALDTGWTSPPKDFKKWGELVRQWVLHSVARYGKAEVESWYWEVWNEPDLTMYYWHGTPEDYDKLYDFAADAVKRALPTARVGGPASTGPAGKSGAPFLKQFLEHCAHGHNYATGKTGAPLDFISFHAKGHPDMVGDHVRMGLSNQLLDVDRGFAIVTAFPQFARLPIVLSESDPEGCAACSARTHPANAYRNGTLYPTYVALATASERKLAEKYKVNLEGSLTWAFEFEDQPSFEGFRTLATNGVDKPVLNIFRMAGLMRGQALKLESSGALTLEAMIQSGVRQAPDVDGVAAREDREITAMVWNYHDEEASSEDSPVELKLTGVPATVKRVRLEHYRIDRDHSNAYTVWKQMGSPEAPSPEQTAQLQAAGQLQTLGSPRWIANQAGTVDVKFSLPRQAVSLLEFSW
jgi:xylan 1,4-beta-xylosidase